METFEVRSKSFTIKWVDAPDNSVIRWELKPLKRSINLGIYRHNKPEPPTTASSSQSRDRSVTELSNESTGSLSTHAVDSVTDNNAADSFSMSENLSVDTVNRVPRKMFNAMHENFFSSDPMAATASNPAIAITRAATSTAMTSLTTISALSNTQNGAVDGDSANKPTISSKRKSSSASLASKNRLRRRASSRSSIRSNDGTDSNLDEHIDHHLIREKWVGRCAGDEFVSDAFHVTSGGLFAFVFDNTFSRTKAKKVMFGQWVESEKRSNRSFKNDFGVVPTPAAVADLSIDSLSSSIHPATSVSSRDQQQALEDAETTLDSPISVHTRKLRFQLPEEKQLGKNTFMIRLKGVQYLQGFMKKKRRRAGGNFAKRFFNLNFKYAVLDYYADETSNNIRGNMLVTQTVISADPKLQMLYLDSGMEQWVLKALSQEDFDVWVQAFNYIKRRDKKIRMEGTSVAIDEPMSPYSDQLSYFDDAGVTADEYLDAISGGRSLHDHAAIQKHHAQLNDAFESLQNLADNAMELARCQQQVINRLEESSTSASNSCSEPHRRRSNSLFWKKGHRNSSDTELARTTSNSVSVGPNQFTQSTDSLQSSMTKQGKSQSLLSVIDQLQAGITDIHADCNALLSRMSSIKHPLTRTTTAATSYISQDFFDAQEVIQEMNDSVMIVSDDERAPEQPSKTYDEKDNIFETQLSTPVSSTSLSSDMEEDEDEQSSQLIRSVKHLSVLQEEALPEKPHDMYPLTFDYDISYRKDVPPSVAEPPSLISIFRKSLGKDLTSITMPIASNEPLSFLQKYAESYEYADLLNDAYNSPVDNGERILKVACFAISYLSSYRSNVRSLRKPFNPLLGETFEMVRPELGIRLISEKVVHHPVIFAAYVESEHWSIGHCFSPEQKYYGKTAEINIDGKVCLQYDLGETYEWTQPTTVLRNMIAFTGEKYTEPVDKMTVRCNSGYMATVTFVPERSHFTNRRSEKVVVKVTAPDNKKLVKTVSGTWTSSMQFDDTGYPVWQVHKLVSDYENKYGFTEFAASLNDMTTIDEECAPTDSRRRPDQKMYEQGDVEHAEELKLDLEQRQRLRRQDEDGAPTVHNPVFFKKAGPGRLDYQYIQGEESYWERRKGQKWNGLIKLW
ncbi:hypothetical protein FOA43_002686 [Brettanomyces nanus]|uniref:PH domain-containing protein n=1 Tax=Eeniella nana TaxID=13502 RepID=A0A875S350_EENNA|nr:uncharacterized protein FOA43_002686 [Brettanomyces nanus]QPG75333.1 hypothetical protein FOA43_002686 [Brettanomyces nanus]